MEMENKEKAIYLQQLEFVEGHKKYRLAYWIIGKKGMAKGKWVFGRFAPMVIKEAFEKMRKVYEENGFLFCAIF